MLVSFSVQNFRSFSDKQTISLVAGASAKKNPDIAFESHNSLAPHLLKSACIFGANGSGKSNLILAMDFFRYFIISSAKETQEGDEIEVTPHLFHSDFRVKPSEFEITFIYEEVLYQYGFAIDSERVWGEWLFSRPNTDKSRTRVLFQREYDAEKNDYVWDINKTYIKGERETWKNLTRSNALFLSQAVQLNAKDLQKPFKWIQQYFHPITSAQRLSREFTVKQCVKEGWKDRIVKLLQSIDLRIQDLDIATEDVGISDLPKDLPKILKNEIINKLKNENMAFRTLEIKSYHKDNHDNLVALDFDEESDGTKVIFSLSGPWLHVLESGNTLIVDELHNSLHPHALKTLISLFHNPEINTKNAQLIFTSHEPSIMTKGFMHKDQIWLMEKNDLESTELIPLSDFDIRDRDIDNFQKAYLNGRYGGVPRLEDSLDG